MKLFTLLLLALAAVLAAGADSSTAPCARETEACIRDFTGMCLNCIAGGVVPDTTKVETCEEASMEFFAIYQNNDCNPYEGVLGAYLDCVWNAADCSGAATMIVGAATMLASVALSAFLL